MPGSQSSEKGRGLRAQVPRSRHADWTPPPRRRDPVEVLRGQEAGRIASLLPLRHHRMAVSPFTFFRGAAAIMAEDLAHTPACGLRVQACGDAHLANFGIYATPERRVVFDVNDFDETLEAPFEWDVKRLATSLVVAGRDRGFAAAECQAAAQAAVAAYRARTAAAAGMGHLEVWYARLDADELIQLSERAADRKLASDVLRKALRATNLGALDKLTEVAGGERRIIDSPPLIEHLPQPGDRVDAAAVIAEYAASLSDATRMLLTRYRVVDWARKVVGVGSVGTDDAVVLLVGDSDSDPLFLQVKEAGASVLEPFAGASPYDNHGRRVVAGQRLIQSASDLFLGWTRLGERDYYVRQLRDMKGSVPVDKLSAQELAQYGRACGEAMALGHARSGDPSAIAGYLGSGDRFDEAIAAFAVAYADQNAADYEAFLAILGGPNRDNAA
ncbi:MAG TPA: DUF2252 domain-containing protein [Solirubrobacteraceae bacterium]|nr:DUF2252 domain-containing protein [Solirubrobacteraceae bacterium]